MCVCAKSLHSCPTLCNPMDCSTPRSSAPGSLQARIAKWVAIPYSRGSSWPRDWTCMSCNSCTAGGFLHLSHGGKPISHPESESESRSVMSDSLQPHGLYRPWNSPGQNTGVGSLSLFQGIFPTQGSNPGLPHCRQILYELSLKRSPKIVDCVAYPFSSISSRARNQTGVSCIAVRFFTNWATREAPYLTLARHIPTLCIFLWDYYQCWDKSMINLLWLSVY